MTEMYTRHRRRSLSVYDLRFNKYSTLVFHFQSILVNFSECTQCQSVRMFLLQWRMNCSAALQSVSTSQICMFEAMICLWSVFILLNAFYCVVDRALKLLNYTNKVRSMVHHHRSTKNILILNIR